MVAINFQTSYDVHFFFFLHIHFRNHLVLILDLPQQSIEEEELKQQHLSIIPQDLSLDLEEDLADIIALVLLTQISRSIWRMLLSQLF